jgi:hypothetical protein
MAIMLFGLTTVTKAQTLKSYTIGDQLIGDSVLRTTVAGIKGSIFALTLNDNRIYMLMFLPTEDGEHDSRLYHADIARLVKGLEAKYNIKMIKKTEEHGDFVEYYRTKDFSFVVLLEHNQFMTPPYKMFLSIVDNDLSAIHDEEEQIRRNNDF